MKKTIKVIMVVGVTLSSLVFLSSACFALNQQFGKSKQARSTSGEQSASYKQSESKPEEQVPDQTGNVDDLLEQKGNKKELGQLRGMGTLNRSMSQSPSTGEISPNVNFDGRNPQDSQDH